MAEIAVRSLCGKIRVDRRSLFYYVSCGLSRKGGMCHLCRLGAGSVHGGTPDSTRLVICTHFPNACTISGASVECSLVATRSIVDVLGRRRSRRAWLLPFAGGYLVESVSHGHGPSRHVPLWFLPASSPWFMLAHPHYGWPEQLVCPPLGGGGRMCSICIGVSS